MTLEKRLPTRREMFGHAERFGAALPHRGSNGSLRPGDWEIPAQQLYNNAPGLSRRFRVLQWFVIHPQGESPPEPPILGLEVTRELDKDLRERVRATPAT
jgi:hypothetical protein